MDYSASEQTTPSNQNLRPTLLIKLSLISLVIFFAEVFLVNPILQSLGRNYGHFSRSQEISFSVLVPLSGIMQLCVLLTPILAIISLIRHERFRWLSIIILVIVGGGLIVLFWEQLNTLLMIYLAPDHRGYSFFS